MMIAGKLRRISSQDESSENRNPVHTCYLVDYSFHLQRIGNSRPLSINDASVFLPIEPPWAILSDDLSSNLGNEKA